MKTKTNTMPVDDIRAAAAGLRALRAKMTFVVPLTPAERQEHRSNSIGFKKLRMVANRALAARQHRDLLPPAFDLRKFEREAALTGALGECLAAADEIRAAIRDTLLGVGYQAIAASASAYAHIKVASNAEESLKRTVEKLGARGARSTVKGSEPSEVPKPAEPAEAPAPVEPVVTPDDKAA